MKTLFVAGKVNSPVFQRIRLLAENLKSHVVNQVEVKTLHEFDYHDHLRQQTTKYAVHERQHPDCYIVVDDKEVKTANEFVQFVKNQYNVVEDDGKDYENIAKTEFQAFINARETTVVYMDISINDKAVGRLLIELQHKVCPKLSDQFIKLIKGFPAPWDNETTITYKGKEFSRLVKSGWIQGGEIRKHDEIWEGDVIEDENFILSHSHRGTLSFVNHGPHTNYSQFMITFKQIPHFNQKYVVVGRVIDGANVLNQMEDVECRIERPVDAIRIEGCGVYDFS